MFSESVDDLNIGGVGIYLRPHVNNSPIRSFQEFLAHMEEMPNGSPYNINESGIGNITQSMTGYEYKLTEDVDIAQSTFNVEAGSVIALTSDYEATGDNNAVKPVGESGYIYFGGANKNYVYTLNTSFKLSEVGVCSSDYKVSGDIDKDYKDTYKRKHVLSEKVDVSFNDLTIFDAGSYGDARSHTFVDIAIVNRKSEKVIYIDNVKSTSLPDITDGDISKISFTFSKSGSSLDTILYIGV